MPFMYFAYGSNMWLPQMRSRCSSAEPIAPGRLRGWKAVYDKPSTDGSAKMNIRPDDESHIHGVLYRIDDAETQDLDAAEPGYERIEVTAETDRAGYVDALTYRWTDPGTESKPYHWYAEAVRAGAEQHGLPDHYVGSILTVESTDDPLASTIRPAGPSDLPAMQEILSRALTVWGDRYTIHPGDLAWWMWHDDPRYPDSVSYWLQPGRGLVVIDSRSNEINAFAVESRDRISLIEWAQRRLGGMGEVGYVSDSDAVLLDYLNARAYRPVHTSYHFRWQLPSGVPDMSLPDGWELRPVEGVREADLRRRASHSAFRSTMAPEAHLKRYLRFMGSPVYSRVRDLVAVAPNGEIASFMVWWPDDTGIAQIEPFGTHVRYQRQGIGTALIHFALRRMKEEGMGTARVLTDDYRDNATAFYTAAGFELVDRVRWYGARG